MYLSITLDRNAAKPVIIYSAAGGTSIEDVAHETPELIHKLYVDIKKGLQEEDLVDVYKHLGLEYKYSKDMRKILMKLYNTFIEKDASLIEINPLAVTCKGLICLDSKVTIDENAEFRQPQLKAIEDLSQQNYFERVAHKYDLNYIHIGGDIGCLVNGAGLAMSTMDIIKNYGGEPANFLDVGGSASG
jgi:succinyl-CoA synthetase beta subunit